jgi:hypothetical protein
VNDAASPIVRLLLGALPWGGSKEQLARALGTPGEAELMHWGALQLISWRSRRTVQSPHDESGPLRISVVPETE